MKRLVAIVGPTGIGKSRLAVHLAEIFDGEIVGTDSRQVYRYTDIGTAKPGPDETSRVPHHLVDIINPDEDFSLAQFQEKAYAAIDGIHHRHRLPFLVGGSGLYIWSVIEGWQIPRVSPDPEFRANLEKRAGDTGIEELYRELVNIDPAAAKKIDPRNIRRVIRALEVHQKTDMPFSRQSGKRAPDLESLIIGLTTDRAELYRRVDQRVDDMLERGLVSEVENLLKMGYDIDLPALSGIGYRQIRQFLSGELTLDAARHKIKTGTHRFIRHQYAWFRLKDERIHWFDIQRQTYTEIEKAVKDFTGS